MFRQWSIQECAEKMFNGPGFLSQLPHSMILCAITAQIPSVQHPLGTASSQ